MEFEYENKKLFDILEKYNEAIDDTNLIIRSLPDMYKNDLNLLESLSKMYDNKLRLMKEGLNKPYFARIDFKDSKNSKLYQCYIGKVGVNDSDNNIITVDWRAPIANMYYDSNIGKASYYSPSGIISGELLIKRQIDIQNGKLMKINDVDTVSNDEILKPYLGVTADNRLKNIVSTIQTEQNEIIRDDLRKNLIVQGVAGSGKTTVALHRIAYLVYNYQKKINPNQYMVIGPNMFFLDYISSVLPDLDANLVEQVTFEKLIQEYIGENILMNSSEKQLVKSLNNDNKINISQFKNSLKYKEIIDKFVEDFNKEVVPKKDFVVKGITILPQSIIKEIYDEIPKKRFTTIESRIEKTILLTSSYIDKKPSLKTKINDMTINLSLNERDFIKKEIRNNFNQSLRQYLSKFLKTKTTTIYTEFNKNIMKYTDGKNIDIVNEIKIHNEYNIKNKKYDFDDLAALGYIKNCINGSGDYEKFRHVVVDEAQDYGDFNFLLLKQMMKKSSFSIYGDIAQSIYSYRSIDNWESVAQIFDNKIDIKYLLKSYRTTIEIMKEANLITSHINIKPAVPVIRHGDSVGYYKSNENIIDKVMEYINKYQNQRRKSIAIICKTAPEATNIHQQLVNNGINAECIVSADNKYSGGICVTTSYLAKGLEFDSVIITNASEEKYTSDNVNDMKLLYVAMTRALHNLDIFYSGKLTKPLKAKNL